MALRRFISAKPDRRKAILALAAAGIVVSGLFPPWLYTFDKAPSRDAAGGHWEVSAGFRFFFDPPGCRLDEAVQNKSLGDYVDTYKAWAGVKLDFGRLLVEWTCVLAVAGAAWGIVRLGQEHRLQSLATPGSKPFAREEIL